MTGSFPDAGTGRTLLLLRHASARPFPAGPGGGDHDRDLDEAGRADAAAMGDRMRGRGLEPDLALVSGALRTRRSWALLGGFGAGASGMRVVDGLYLADADRLLATLRAVPGSCRRVLVVGHNPGLHRLALLLAGERAPPALGAGLPTCTLVALRASGDWAELDPHRIDAVEVLEPRNGRPGRG